MPPKNTDFDKETGDRLRHAREALGIAQSDFAAALGVKPQRLNNWESGDNGIPPPQLVRIWKTFGISPDYVYIGLVGNCSGTTKDKILALRVVKAGSEQHKRPKRAKVALP